MKKLIFRVWDKSNEYLIISMSLEDLCKMMLSGCYYNLYAEFPIRLGEHEVLQYTGFDDKSGDPIFEGDILEVAGGSRITVESLEAFLIYCGRYEEKHGVPLFPSVQVVGNIYEAKLCP